MIRSLLVGCPRSGTTLLQSLLCSHPQLACLSETHFFPRVLSGSRRHKLGIASSDAVRELRRIAEQLEQPRVAEYAEKSLFFIRKVVRLFVEAADGYSRDASCLGWLEKTPEHLIYLPQIEHYIPDIRVIHIFRRGRDVVASLFDVTRKYPHAWGGKPWSVERCIEAWVNHLAMTVLYTGADNHMIISYDNIAQDPEKELYELWRFLSLPETEFSDTRFAQSINTSVPMGAPWQEVSTTVKNRKNEKFRSLFNEQEQWKIVQLLRDAVSAKQLKINGELAPV